jgi:hypothetical protein
MDARTDALLDKLIAKKIKEDAAVKVTDAQIDNQAKFLLRWAKSMPISSYMTGSTMFTKGKTRLATMLYPAMVKGLLAKGYATGTETRFTMNKDAVKAIK